MDADYRAANLPEVVKFVDNLNRSKKASLPRLLTTYKTLFDGTLWDWKTVPVKLELKLGTKPVHSRDFPVLYIRKDTFHTALKQIVKLGIIIKDSNPPWASPMLIIPNADNTVRAVSDFRNVDLSFELIK